MEEERTRFEAPDQAIAVTKKGEETKGRKKCGKVGRGSPGEEQSEACSRSSIYHLGK